MQEPGRAARTLAQLASAWRSATLVLRSFTRAKGFAAAAILTTALGIGANTVVFSMFDRMLFRPLPYSEPDRLVQLYSRVHVGGPFPRGTALLPLAVTQDLARERNLFTGVAWVSGSPLPVAPGPDQAALLLTGVTPETLDVLGVRPLTGPGFSAVGVLGGDERPVLLAYETWQRRYGASEEVLSLAWTANDAHWRVVGVLPQGFLLPSSAVVAARSDGVYGIDPGFAGTGTLERQVPAPFARLAPEMSIAVAQGRVNTLVRSRFRQTASFKGVTMRPLQSGLSITARPYVWLALAGAWVVLGATCLSLAILLLTWNQSRRQEAGIRLALGASPRQLVTTTLLESTLICGAGAVIGWLGYAWTRSLFVSVMPQGLQSFAAETVDLRVIAATCGIALTTAIAAGTLPAIRTSRMAPLDLFRPQPDSLGTGRLVGGPILVSVQAAFGVVLLVGALVTVPAVLRFLLKSPGFEANDLFVVTLPSGSNNQGSVREEMRFGFAALETIRGLPGVVSAGLSATDPFSGGSVDSRFDPLSLRSSGSPFWTGRGFDGRTLAASAGFFETLAVPMIAGRAFSEGEVQQQALVAIVNGSGARALWPALPVAGVVGQMVMTDDGQRVVVGVAADIRLGTERHSTPDIFLPLTANERYRQPHVLRVVLRMAQGRVPDRALLWSRLREQLPPKTGGMVQSVVAELEPSLEKQRLLAVVFGTLAGITLSLTTIALYGLASFEVGRRRYEITVRLALGATPQALRRRLAVVAVKPVLAGVVIGLPASWLGVTLLARSVPTVNAGEPRLYAAAAGALLVAALLAVWIPARRASMMRASEILRSS
jgi:predicted permease